MAGLLKKVSLLALLCATAWAGNFQSAQAQTFSIEDSTRRMLTYFREQTKNENLKQAIKEALISYRGNTINDSLAKKLLIIDSILVDALQPDQQRILSYANMLTGLLRQLAPRGEHPQYARSLSTLALLYRNLGQQEKALPLFEQEKTIKRKTAGEKHPDYATSLNNIASVYQDMGQYEKARPLFEQAIAIRKETVGEGHPDYATGLNDLAGLYQEMGQYEKARTLLVQAIAIRKKALGEEHPEYASGLNNLALLYWKMGKYEKALPLYEQAIAIYKRTVGEEHTEYSNSLNNLAVLYDEMGAYEKSLPLYEQVAAIEKKVLGEEHPEYATSLSNLAGLYHLMGRYEKALPLVERTVAIKKKALGEEHPGYATGLNNLALLLQEMGQYEKALPLYEQAKAIDKKTLGPEHPDYVTDLVNLASLYQDMGQYEKALAIKEQATAIRKKTVGEEHADYALSLNGLASLYHDMGKYEKALPLYEQASVIVKKAVGGKHPEYAASLNNLAVLYKEIGQQEKALPLYEQAVAINKKALGEEHPGYATDLNNLAYLYTEMGQHEKALPIFKQAIAIKKKALGEAHPDYATCLHNLAFLYKEMGQLEKALPLYQQATAIDKKALGEEHPDYATDVKNLASLYQEMAQYDKALPLQEKATAIRKKTLGVEHPSYARSLNDLALLYQDMGQHEKALPLLTDASNIILHHLTRTYTTLSEQEKMNLLHKEASRFSHLPSLFYTKRIQSSSVPQQIYSHELALKGMVLEEQKNILNNIRKSNDTTALQLYERWYQNNVFLGKQRLLPEKKRMTTLDSLGEVNNQLEQQLSRRSASFGSLQQRLHLSAKDIAQKLKTGEAAIEFISFRIYNRKWTDSTIYAALLLLPGDTTARFIPLFEEKQLQHLLQSSANAVTYTAIDHLYGKKIATKANVPDSLYQLIWQPLEKYLHHVQTVYYALAGLLHNLAFQALPADSTQLLVDKYQLHQLLSTRTLALPTEVTTKPQSAAMWGHITYSTSYFPDNNIIVSRKKITGSPDAANTTVSAFTLYAPDTKKIRGAAGEWRPLPSTKTELDSLSKLFTRAGISFTTFSDTSATEESFKALSGKSPQVLHMATHGFFLPVKKNKPKDNDPGGGNTFTVQQNPMFRSGLVLSGANSAWIGNNVMAGKEDGILTAYEIAQMDLTGTGLVVLSACETARGHIEGNEGVIGLQRALKMAGVKQMIVSLWQVPDKPTMQLMTSFYNNRLGGQPARQALRNAQLQLKEKYKHPYFWAAFVLVE